MHAYVDIDANMMSNLIYDHAILEFHAMGDMLLMQYDARI